MAVAEVVPDSGIGLEAHLPKKQKPSGANRKAFVLFGNLKIRGEAACLLAKSVENHFEVAGNFLCAAAFYAVARDHRLNFAVFKEGKAGR